MKNIKPILCILATASMALAQSTALADSAASIEQQGNLTAATYDDGGTGNYPIVTTILSQPGVLDGYTYANWAYLAADTTGSLDMFYSSTATGPAANYPHPTVGDTILAQGTYSTFDGIPEMENNAVQAINVFGPGSQGNTPYNPTPVNTTVSAININLATYLADKNLAGGPGIAGNYLQLNNVTVSAGSTALTANFPTHANGTYTISDNTGSMEWFFWASSYSTDGAQGGTPMPTGPVNMDGFVDFFTGTSTAGTTGVAEFVETSITSAVPEPSTMGLYGLGGVVSYLGLKLRSRKTE